MTLETSKNLKDLNVKQLILTNYLGEVIDLSSIFIQVNIYESLFSTTLTGDIIIEDGLNLLNNFPIIGQEKITIYFENPRFNNKPRTFNVVGVSSIKNSTNNDKVQSYVLHFVSPFFIKNKLVSISRRVKGKADDVLLDVLLKDWGLDYKGKYKVEPSDSKIDFVIPYWDPLKFLNYMSDRLIPEGEKYPTYLFYEDFDNLNFIGYDSLLKRTKEPEKIYYAPINLNDGFTTDEKSKNVNRYSINNYVNLLDILDNGVAFNNYLEVDLINKKYSTNKTDYFKDFQNFPTLYKNEILPENNLDGFEYTKSNDKINVLYNFSEDKDMKNYNKWFLYRKGWLAQLNSIKITLEITENVDRKLGDVIEFNIPSREKFESKQMKYAKYINGKYIVSKIRHTIGNDSKGTSTLELLKDSFCEKLSGSKI